MFKYHVWFNGSDRPRSFELPGDELYQAYRRWLEDPALPQKGLVFTYEQSTLALNFAAIALLEIEKPGDMRGKLGFH